MLTKLGGLGISSNEVCATIPIQLFLIVFVGQCQHGIICNIGCGVRSTLSEPLHTVFFSSLLATTLCVITGVCWTQRLINSTVLGRKYCLQTNSIESTLIDKLGKAKIFPKTWCYCRESEETDSVIPVEFGTVHTLVSSLCHIQFCILSTNTTSGSSCVFSRESCTTIHSDSLS